MNYDHFNRTVPAGTGAAVSERAPEVHSALSLLRENAASLDATVTSFMSRCEPMMRAPTPSEPAKGTTLKCSSRIASEIDEVNVILTSLMRAVNEARDRLEV